MSKIVIVGSGISGLVLAYRLAKAAPRLEVTLLEQNPRIGGNIATERSDGFQYEIGPSGFLDNKPATMDLCRELGLGEELVPAGDAATRNRFLFLDGRLKQLPTGFGSFLRSDLLSWRGKLRLLTEPFRRRRQGSADESIADFVRRRVGREAAEVLADALVTGIYAGDATLLSMEATFPRVVALEEQYGSVVKGMIKSARQRRAEAAARGETYQRPGRMWTLRPGLGLLVDTLGRQVKNSFVGVTVRRIQRTAGEGGQPAWVVHGDGQQWPADAVVLTCPAHQQAAILADLDSELTEKVGGIAYNRVAVVALGYRQADVPISLDGFGFIAPQRTRRDVLGVEWASSIYPDRAPAGAVLLRAMCGGWNRPEVVGWDDKQLLEAVRAELRLAMNITAEPILQRIIRWDRAIPQYLIGHLDRVASIKGCLSHYPGLFLGGSAYHGVGINDCAEQAGILATMVAEFLNG